MLSVEDGRALAAAGVMWHPRPGDRFVIDEEQLVGDVFWISDLTIELHHYGDNSVLGFNGTTECALDSVPIDQATWLPREDQLRELLGERLRSMHRRPDGWLVITETSSGRHETIEVDLERAYARALLAATGLGSELPGAMRRHGSRHRPQPDPLRLTAAAAS